MRAYIDTNILVDLVLSRQEFLPDAQRVFALGYAGEAQLMVSALSLSPMLTLSYISAMITAAAEGGGSLWRSMSGVLSPR